jgi:hypothetical protein
MRLHSWKRLWLTRTDAEPELLSHYSEMRERLEAREYVRPVRPTSP